MLNKLKAFMAPYRGEKIICAVSGGADSMALLWGMYLLKDKLQLDISAAHFNHRLRGAESDADEAFVRDFCAGYGIPFVTDSRQVTAGEKGLEAAAREARYAFLKGLPGLVATAHTADDNAETVLMHLVRGTGLKGLGGIMPVNGNLIRPMLNVTRAEVMNFLAEYSIPHREDSSNAGDAFLRNRLRHSVMPLLKQENPSLAENLSAMALRLRQDEESLDRLAQTQKTNSVSGLRLLQPAIRSRVLAQLLLEAGVKEPEAEHIRALEKLVFSEKPSARLAFSNGVVFARDYDVLAPASKTAALQTQDLACPGKSEISGVRITCTPNHSNQRTKNSFAVTPTGNMVVRSRKAGDSIRLLGGTKSLKKLFIDEKIPAAQRDAIPVIADDAGVLGVVGFGGNLDRISAEATVRIEIEYL
ncbi:MAG: tRNA lysidine(34) synthetase TilS [Ruminococcaceae bacterium]|nr:tRNA lysidine(34) synthetase TilS [Oscillospiraceae bacterium]